MAYSKCPKCENTSFEAKENSPSNSNFNLIFIQCRSCGCVVGTMDYYNIGTKLHDLEKKVDTISSVNGSLSSVNSNLNVINQNIAKLYTLIQSFKVK
jgi:hypothetical protein